MPQQGRGQTGQRSYVLSSVTRAAGKCRRIGGGECGYGGFRDGVDMADRAPLASDLEGLTVEDRRLTLHHPGPEDRLDVGTLEAVLLPEAQRRQGGCDAIVRLIAPSCELPWHIYGVSQVSSERSELRGRHPGVQRQM